MTRRVAWAVVYLLLAEWLDMAIAPQLQTAMPSGWDALGAMRLLAMAGVLAGLMRGETAGLAMAVPASLLYGLSLYPGSLGAAMVGFAVVAYGAGVLARHFRFQGVLSRWTVIFALLILERLIWFGVRIFFWPHTPLTIEAPGLALTAMLGAVLVGVFAPRFKINLYGQ